MSKGKLEKFADLAIYPNVLQYPYASMINRSFPLKGQWGTKYFANSNPITLELGCGKGEYALNLARLFPYRNFIGVDIKGARIWTGATQALQEELKNVAFLRTNLEIIDNFFSNNEVEELWFTFSDPQMKNRKKRLTSTFFLERYRKFLTNNGIIHLKTDSNFLYTYTKIMAKHNHLPILEDVEDVHNVNISNENTRQLLSILTAYESQWMERGIPIKYLKIQLPHKIKLEEPDVNIPLDDYRSYKRPKRSGLSLSR